MGLEYAIFLIFLHDADMNLVGRFAALPSMPKILLEVWNKEKFVGEAWLPQLDQIDGDQQSLLLMRVSGSRRDPRKDSVNIRGTVDISARWNNALPFGGSLRFVLIRGSTLKRTDQSCPHVILWMYTTEFSPLWTSRPGTHPINPQFQDSVDLKIPCGNYQSPDDRIMSARAPEEVRPKLNRPKSASGRLQSKQSNGSIRAAVERVPGHPTTSHWGAKMEDVSTHVFCNQIISRFNTERQNRSQMLSVLARQLERYRDAQRVVEEQRKAVVAFSKQLHQRMDNFQREHQVQDSEQTEEIASLHQRLGAMYKGMTEMLQHKGDVHTATARDLQESKQREREQISMIDQLEARNRVLRETLDKTLAQLQDVKGELIDATAGDIP